MLKKFINHLIFSLGLSVIIMLPDHIFHLLNPHYLIEFKVKIFIITYFVSFLILSVESVRVMRFILGFVLLLQFVQFVNFNFFGKLIYPYEVKLFFTEFDEISLALKSNLHVFIPPVIAVLPMAAAIYFAGRIKAELLKFRYSHYLFFALLLILPIKAYRTKNILSFFPSVRSYSFKNTLYAVSYFIGRDLIKKDKIVTKNFKPYIVKEENLSSKNIDVIFIMGESCNYKYMSLYGFDKNTTPLLDKLKGDADFQYRKVVSTATTTWVSLSMFFNTVREPQNFKQLVSAETNLFNLAKKHGFKTYYLSKQKDKVVVNFLSSKNIDLYKNVYDYSTNYDTDMIKDLKNINFKGRNFIVLHQRSSHTPYDKYYPESFDKFKYDKSDYNDYRHKTYLNSILFTDYFLKEVIDTVKQKAKKADAKAIVIFTSDHGEMQGENGKWGHVVLDMGDIKVPFIIYTVNFKQKPDIKHILSHYGIEKFIAKQLGFKIINPNDDNKTIYVNGVDIAGRAGFMKLEREKVYKELYGEKGAKN